MNENFSMQKVLSAKQVVSIMNISKATLYRGIKSGTYPKPIQISKGRVGWLETEIASYINNLSMQR